MLFEIKKEKVDILKHFTGYEDKAVENKRLEYDSRMIEFENYLKGINAKKGSKTAITQKLKIKSNINFALENIEKSILIQGEEQLKRLESVPQPLDPILEHTIFVRKLLKDQLEKLNRK